MKKKIIIPVLIWFVVIPLGANAQQAVGTTGPQASPTPPAPPLLRRVPDLMGWGITYTVEGAASPTKTGSSKEKEKQPEPLQTKSVLKGGGMILELTAKNGGSPLQMWYLPGGVQMRSSDGKTWLVGAGSQAGFETADYSTQDFAGLSWISAQNFKGEVDYKGRKCFVFSDKVVTTDRHELESIRSSMARSFTTVAADENGNINVKSEAAQFHIDDFKKDVYAYIDEESRLPVAIIYKTPNGIVTRTYQFQKITSMPPVPPEVRKSLDSFKQRQKSLSIPHAPI
jgi:hypothetical protein